jgi:hypothetical protein
MVVDRARAYGKNVGDLFITLAFNHPMKDVAFSRCQSYSLKILRCRNRTGRCLLERSESLSFLMSARRNALRWSALNAACL